MAKIIMVQGTSSGVGKSILSTALCRIFTQDGYKVAPFKAQNMSSNAHILDNGYKMARSQAICAYACNKEPDYKMNPILIIPNNKKSEVYLNGVCKNFLSKDEYNKLKSKIINDVLDSFNKLCLENDIVVIEGAGSPVELNLIKDDIVNMGFAKQVNSPVILISDISRGGIFASLYGTIKLLSKNEQNLIKGIVVNKFKGDISYFEDAKNIIQEICNKKVLGIIPYCDINIEDEDSLVENVEKTKELLMKNIEGEKTEFSYRKYLDKQFNLIANTFRDNLNMEEIYNILKGV